ncbi:MAG TPA: HAMP domain-containing sensor histidine kinase [Limnochordia bacterium]|nr:HAMP domain-containing sensor histidine kinase [Limnochordia bacterium]
MNRLLGRMRGNLALRLGLTTGLLLMLAWSGMLAAVYIGTKALYLQQVDRGLARLAVAAARSNASPAPPDLLGFLVPGAGEAAVVRPDGQLHWIRRGRESLASAFTEEVQAARAGRTVRLTRTWSRGDAGTLGDAEGRLEHERAGEVAEAYRVLAAPLGDGSVLLAAVDLDPLQHLLDVLTTMLLLVGAVVTIVGFGVSTWLAKAAFRPLTELAHVAGGIDERHLDRRFAVRTADSTLEGLSQRLNGMLARLEAAFGARHRFIDAAAHELRTPLSALKTELDIALRRPRTADEYRASLAAAQAATNRLIVQAEELLDLARLRRTEVASVARLEPRAVLQEVGETMAPLAAAQGVRLAVESPDLGPVYGDASLIRRALINLVDNAVRAASPGGSVEVEASLIDGAIVIRVSDNGRGIPADALEHIVAPFYRVEGEVSRGRTGSGLGLAIVAEIMEAHGGRVAFTSELGSGTCAQLSWPAAPRG